MRTLTNKLHSLTLHGVRISHKTCWTFVTLRTRDGRMGYGEATLTGREDLLEAAAQTLAPLALAASLDSPGEFAVAHAFFHNGSRLARVSRIQIFLPSKSSPHSFANDTTRVLPFIRFTWLPNHPPHP